LVFDIGANIGQTVAKFVGVNSKVIAVEPQKNLTSNKRFKGVHVIKHMCVSNKIGEETFYVCGHHSTSSCRKDWKIHRPNEKWTKTTVQTTTLDALIEEFGKPKYIKIDVEGYEDKVLDGLSHKIDLISFEFSRWFEDCTIRCLDILDERFGFKKLMPFVKKKFTAKVNGKTVNKQYAYCGNYYTKDEFIKDLDKFVKLTAIDNRNVGDILVIS